ncbi:ATP-dependent helicase [Streptomonospora wellingtoniae]|uniref:DNA 3'-5' helicase n=1 Tax=Streptomonospora wellingtoniae TaxID=3075544 RepID=A0ABU2KQF2_9ACTN|nr:ATP-dependent DNA helicase [Streptomonospora sp. DSM 45055]MDT0301499.1 ATP-dependent DNA helicase [Streptomonospora sp. DSM 45055]
MRRVHAEVPPPLLDDNQRRVVAHKGGPLLVLAGPGTGKTTTVVEAVVDRIENRGVDPARILVLTFSRKAAQELRERITARLRRTTREPLALTFHSYAYALIRREFGLQGDHAPRLLSGPEQLMEVRELLAGESADGAAMWPERLRPALETRGFAEELRDFLMRAQERGIDSAALDRLGREYRRDDWVAAGDFLDRYTGRFDVAPVPTFNYAELVRVAANLLNDPGVQARERAAREVVFVDEYQDTDPAQEELLYALAGEGRDLVAVGDPDQSVYGFRGADVRNILEFPRRFPSPGGEPAPVVALRTCRRSGAGLLTASRGVARRLPAAPAPGGGPVNAHRALTPAGSAPEGEAQVLLAESPAQEAAVIADILRRAHLIDAVPWSQMAVLVRSASKQLPTLRRALSAAGVPVAVGGDEMPLAVEPVVRALLLLLRCALRPETIDEAAAHELLTSHFGEADTVRLRRLARALRRLDLDYRAAQRRAGEAPADSGEGGDARDGPGGEEQGPDAAPEPEPSDGAAHAHPRGSRPSSALIADALRDPRELTLVDPEVAAPARRIAGHLRLIRDRAAAGGSAEEVLWEVWQASGLSERLLRASQAGGRRGAAADRDLDAVVAVFESAARYCDRLPPGLPLGFLEDLEAQEIPADSLAERAPEGEAVRILTAHRSKGLEWDLTVVAGVQEGDWPDLRLRGSLLGVEQLVDTSAGFGAPPGAGPEYAAGAAGAAAASKLLDEERRLFYVACTRARRRLVVTAVGGDDTEERPSRFLTELGMGEPERVSTGRRWLSLPALVADLRSVVSDPQRPDPLRRAAAAHLARLADEGVRGADPAEWYALTAVSDDRPLVDGADEGAIRVSPSQVERFTTCQLRWLLENAAGASSMEVTSALGSIVHAVAVLVADGAAMEDVRRSMDDIWSELDFGGPWFAGKERERADEMVRKLIAWHESGERELVVTEEGFKVDIGGIEITGRVDRLEKDAQGRAVVVDIKTGNGRPKDAELARHPQLGVYQLAVLESAFAQFGLTAPGGAELVQVGTKASFKHGARTQAQGPLGEDPEPGWSAELVRGVAEGMSGARFQAVRNEFCDSCAVRSSCPAHDEGKRV